jgi:hypothetical protein
VAGDRYGEFACYWLNCFEGNAVALVITGIGDKGNLKSERVGFRVTSSGDLKYFVVLSTKFNDGGFFNRSDAAYWFTPEVVQMGDKVVLYTRVGVDSFQENDDGTKTYFKYWGLAQSLFSDPSRGIVVAEVTNWFVSRNF